MQNPLSQADRPHTLFADAPSEIPLPTTDKVPTDMPGELCVVCCYMCIVIYYATSKKGQWSPTEFSQPSRPPNTVARRTKNQNRTCRCLDQVKSAPEGSFQIHFSTMHA